MFITFKGCNVVCSEPHRKRGIEINKVKHIFEYISGQFHYCTRSQLLLPHIIYLSMPPKNKRKLKRQDKKREPQQSDREDYYAAFRLMSPRILW